MNDRERRDDLIRKLEESLRRMEEADPDDIESTEYQDILKRLVDLREHNSIG